MSLLIVLSIITTLRELKFMSENSQYGKNISVYSILLNCIWNIVVFFSQFMSSIKTATDDFSLALPTILIFVYILIFQMNMFSLIWKSRNDEFILSQVSPEEMRSNLFRFNCWIYSLAIFGIMVLSNFIFSEVSLSIYIMLLWIPQIIHNFVHVRSKAPSLLYIMSVTLEHLYTLVTIILILGIHSID